MAFVLVVDDDEEYGPFMESLLRRFGYKTFCTTRGDFALRCTLEFRPDLIVLDYCLPGAFTGDKTLRVLKTQEATKDIPVLVVSGEWHTPEHENAVFDAGADLFMSKGEVGNLIKSGDLERHLASLVLRRRYAPQSPGLAAAQERTPSGLGRVLVVDDDPEVLSLIEELLRDQGYAVLTASTALEGLALARQGRPDMLVLDMTLTDMSGLEICAQMKADAATRDVPVLAISGRRSDSAAQEAVRRGADCFMSKPLDLRKFLGMTGALLARRAVRADSPGVYRFGDDLIVDEERRSVFVGGRAADGLTSRLFLLLCEFARAAGQILTRDQLIVRVWDGEDVNDRVVDRSVARLRECLGEPVGRWIVTCPGHGYRFVPENRPAGKFAVVD